MNVCIKFDYTFQLVFMDFLAYSSSIEGIRIVPLVLALWFCFISSFSLILIHTPISKEE